ncbi:unnamed protein product [Bursaphelenchus okinawaensis]|uniref:Arrestin C-terminal-like domain-containing protein n=1 Tax=Bursaphelenchus okinawaensis TaxID=465554 RepID=A0A811JV82_9BILA|nr:unnamed protein product [Bursaphelenchus okinawaensis]CAG9084779.1 unnamed protein product [Bursaphelenchus okinawaensis]
MASLIASEAKKLLQDIHPSELLSIVLDNSAGWVMAGTQVTGKVIVRPKESVKSNGIHIHFKGIAKTSWSSSEYLGAQHKGKKLIQRSGEVVYSNEELCLWKPQTSDKHLPMNEMILPFAFTVPHVCPPSFEGTDGHIRYTLKAVLSRPWFLDCKQYLSFTVLPYIDYAAHPSAFQPQTASGEKEFSGFFGKNAIKVTVTAPKLRYIPGETIDLNVQITNNSDKKISALKCEILQNANYIGTTFNDYRGNPIQVAQASGAAKDKKVTTIRKEHRHEFQNSMKGNFNHVFTVPLPSLVPTFNNCPVINVDYQLKIYIIIHNQLPVQIFLPIMIDTAVIQPNMPPKIQNQQQYYPQPVATSSSVDINPDGIYPMLPTAPPPDYNSLQPMPSDESNNEKRFSTVTDCSEPPPEYQPNYPSLK